MNNFKRSQLFYSKQNFIFKGRPVPRLLKTVFVDYVARFLGTNLYSSKFMNVNRDDDSSLLLIQPLGQSDVEKFFIGVLILLEGQLRGATLKKSMDRLDEKKMKVNESEVLDMIREDWTNVARAVDRLLFWVFFLLTLMTGFLFFL